MARRPAPERVGEHAWLMELAERRELPLPAEVLAIQSLRVAQGDPAVAVAAMHALFRRVANAVDDGLRLALRPTPRLFGTYRTRPKRGEARPYETVLSSLEPLEASCACADFARASLVICKHVVAVLAWIYAKPTRVVRALAEQAKQPRRALLEWDPVRPLHGAGDWLERVTLQSGELARPTWLEAACTGDPRARLAAVRRLLSLAEQGSSNPALLALLTREGELLAQRIDGEVLVRRLDAALAKLRRKPFPFQLEGIQRFLLTGRMLLADDMGLGKTTQAIAACHVLHTTHRAPRGLVITPASLKHQWLREWREVSSVPATVVEGTRAAREALYLAKKPGFLILNYEQLLKDLELVRTFDPSVVVLDEAQRIKNWETKTSAAVHGLEPPYRLVLTGTPLENRLDELANIFGWVDELALEPTWRLEPFHSYVEPTAEGAGEIRGARNLDVLRGRLAQGMTRRTRAEVLGELPPRTDTRVPVGLTPAQRAEHAALDPSIAKLAHIAQGRGLRRVEFERLMRLLTLQRMICNGLALSQFTATWPEIQHRAPAGELDRIASPKLVELRDLIYELAVLQRRKVVVFSQWRRMLTLAAWAASDVLDAASLRHAFFSGAEAPAVRAANVEQFHADPKLAVLFLTDSGGVGLNLQHAASACINVELPWNPAVLEQRIGRIYRMGQGSPISVYNLVSESGLEARIASLVADKGELFTGLFDGDAVELTFSSSSTFREKLALLVDQPAPAAEPVFSPEPTLDESLFDEPTTLDELPRDPMPVELSTPLTQVALPFGPEFAPANDVGSRRARSPATKPAPSPAAVPTAAPAPTAAPTSQGPLTVRRTAGGIVIEAAPEVQDLIASLFEQLSAALRASPTRIDKT